jgi:tRNA (guanosine-2'-O-)-methyltransferase
MTPERLKKIQQVVANRQLDLTVVLENVRDQHNIGAVLRSCDSIGISEVFVLYSEAELRQTDFIKIGKRTTAGSRRWVDVHFFTDTAACFQAVKKRYKRVLSTHLSEHAQSLYQLDLTQPTAFLFGNERDGISEEALSYSDGNFLIPQMGMVASLNISVACAVTLYETFRQRQEAELYGTKLSTFSPAQQALLADYKDRKNAKDPEYYIIEKSND